ncbi:MAG: hypothetical protein H7831_04650 [Magnetococcus sp. WYHC-3]
MVPESKGEGEGKSIYGDSYDEKEDWKKVRNDLIKAGRVTRIVVATLIREFFYEARGLVFLSTPLLVAVALDRTGHSNAADNVIFWGYVIPGILGILFYRR